jgi:peptidoglycan/xylan/chitin deacetylase (PgdA/CDA1 family)
VPRTLYRIAERVGVPKIWSTLRPGATILMYHGFTDRRSFEGVIDHQRMRLHVDAFRKHVEHLVDNYEVIPLSVLVSLYREGRPIPKRAVVITFDDGYRSCYTLAHPVLKEFRVPATLFVATDFVYERKPLWHDRVEYAVHATKNSSIDVAMGDGIAGSRRCRTVPEKLGALRAFYPALKRMDQRRRDVVIDELERNAGARIDLSDGSLEMYAPATPAELKSMTAEGLVEVGCHTKTHAVLSRCSPAQTLDEVALSKTTLERELSSACKLFCYPNGTKADFDDRTRNALVDAGFHCALTTIPGKNGADADPMELLRISAPADAAEFSLAVSGLRTELARAYRAVKRAMGRGPEVVGGM